MDEQQVIAGKLPTILWYYGIIILMSFENSGCIEIGVNIKRININRVQVVHHYNECHPSHPRQSKSVSTT